MMADSSLVFVGCPRKELGTRFQNTTRPGIVKRTGVRISRSTPLHRIQELLRLRLPKSGSPVRAFALTYRRPTCTAVYMNAVYTTANPTLTAITPMINATMITHPLPISCGHSTPAL